MKIKQILQKWLINNIGYKIMAIVFAFILWLAIMNIQDPTESKTISNITVTKINTEVIPDGEYAVTVKSGDTATIVVEGKRSLVRNLTASDFSAVANMEELSITNAVPITITMVGDKARNAGSLTITQITHSMIIQLEDITSRTMDVTLNYTGTLKDNVVIDDAVINPAQIKVTAPVSVLESINRVEAVINYADVDEGVSLRATPALYNYGGGVISVSSENGVEIDCDEVTVDFDVKHIKTVPVSINVIGTPADGYEYTNTTYSFTNVTLKGSSETLKGISRISLPSSLLDITDETRDVSISVNLNEYAPEGTVVHDNNVNLVITAHIIEKETTTTTTAATSSTAAETDENGETLQPTAANSVSVEEEAKETSEPETTSKKAN